MPLIVGEAQDAMRICELALARGVFAQAIRPPTVPAMTSRLRLAVMATHRPQELRAAARTLAGAARSSGFDPRAREADAHPERAHREPGHREPGHREPADEPSPAEFEPAARRSPTAPAGVFDFEASEPVRRAA
jgi:glycine C-acetyltransferase/8-amino-7-oxononanoate synthase